MMFSFVVHPNFGHQQKLLDYIINKKGENHGSSKSQTNVLGFRFRNSFSLCIVQSSIICHDQEYTPNK